jgi:hypothetical protein
MKLHIRNTKEVALRTYLEKSETKEVKQIWILSF